MIDRDYKVAVIGCGSWGTALASLLAQRGASVVIWGRNEDVIRSINEEHRNHAYLPGVDLPEGIKATADPVDLADADVALFVVPSKAVRRVAKQFSEANVFSTETIFVSCIKGIELETGSRMTEIIAEAFPDNPVSVMSGPTHAEEVARKMPAAVVVGAWDHEVALQLQDLFTTPWFRSYTSEDVVGIEWAGAVKNIFAIAAGIVDGMGLGDNAKAALVTRGLAELVRIGIEFGGRPETFQGLSGVGDLMVTCYSAHSRNNRVGLGLGKGKSLQEVVDSMNMVAEGVPNTLSIYKSTRKLGVRTPLIDQIHAIVNDGKPAQEALVELLSRDPRPEAE